MKMRKAIIPALAMAALPLFGAVAPVPAPENVPELTKTGRLDERFLLNSLRE